ncbi:MAG: hypothetical protein RJA20_2710 [Bacteroidota bacterium]
MKQKNARISRSKWIILTLLSAFFFSPAEAQIEKNAPLKRYSTGKQHCGPLTDMANFSCAEATARPFE